MTTGEIDDLILGTSGASWTKVAMLMAIALTEWNLGLPESEDDAACVAGRIEALIDIGALEVRGDPANWRYSEIRRAGSGNHPPNSSLKRTNQSLRD